MFVSLDCRLSNYMSVLLKLNKISVFRLDHLCLWNFPNRSMRNKLRQDSMLTKPGSIKVDLCIMVDLMLLNDIFRTWKLAIGQIKLKGDIRRNLEILMEQGTTLKYSHNFGKIIHILEKLISSDMLFFEVITLSVSIQLNG